MYFLAAIIMDPATTQLIVLLQKQQEQSEMQMRLMEQQLADQAEQHKKQMQAIISKFSAAGSTPSISSVGPVFQPFDASAELWKDYYVRFQTYAGVNSVPDEKVPQVFLTNQTQDTYKLLAT